MTTIGGKQNNGLKSTKLVQKKGQGVTITTLAQCILATDLWNLRSVDIIRDNVQWKSLANHLNVKAKNLPGLEDCLLRKITR